MFDIAWSELLIVAVIAILVVGPKELPGMLRSLGRMLGKLRSTADEFRKQFDEAVREAGAEDLQREMRSLRQNNPLTQVRDSIEDATRDPMTKKSVKNEPSEPKADEPAGVGDDDLGPPPPLPPRDEASASKPAAQETATATAAASDVSDTPQPASSPAKESAGNGGANEIRLNGEHRPQAN